MQPVVVPRVLLGCGWGAVATDTCHGGPLSTTERVRRIAALTTLLMVALAACGGDEDTGPTDPPPDIVGSYEGNWSFSFTYTPAGNDQEILCPGAVSILMQRADGTFTGNWDQPFTGDDCSEASGTLAGIVEPDGAITIVALTSGGGGSGTTLEDATEGECVTTSVSNAYTGSADGSTFEISYTINGDCGQAGTVMWVTAFSGESTT